MLRVRIVDRVFGYGVADATVDLPSGESVAGDEDGRFALAWDGSSSGQEMRVHAFGYAELVWKPSGSEGSDETTLRLQPLQEAGVVVQRSDGSPAENLVVHWRPFDEDGLRTGGAATGATLTTTTDRLGRTSVAAARAVKASLELPSPAPEGSAVVAPGQWVRLMLPECEVEVRFLEAGSLEPMGGLPIEVQFPMDVSSRPYHGSTDGSGSIRVAGTHAPILMRLGGALALEYELSVADACAVLESEGGELKTVLRIDACGCEAELAVEVAPCGGSIYLRDADSGAGIEGYAFIDSASGLPVPSAVGGDLPPRPWRAVAAKLGSGQELSVRNGQLYLPCHLTSRSAQMREDRGTIVVSVLGYRPLQIPTTEFAGLLQGTAEPPTYRLEKADRIRLNIVLQGGAPYAGRARVTSLEHNAVLYDDTAVDADGFRALDAFGGDLIVQVLGAEYRVTPSGPAQTEEVLTLVLPYGGASLRITGIPPSARRTELVARSEARPDSVAFVPSSWDVDWVEFADLPPGNYWVGPEAWVRSMESQATASAAAARVALSAGEARVLEWFPGWSQGEDVEGVVKVEVQSGGSPFLIPIMSVPLAGNVILGRSMPHIPLSADGRYRIARGDPLPELIAVCRLDDPRWNGNTAFHVVEVIAPGESVHIPTKRVRLEWKGTPSDEPVPVAYTIPIEQLRYPTRTFHSKSKTRWFTDRPLELAAVPLYVGELFLSDRVLALPEDGSQETLTVDLSALPRAK